MTDEKRHNPDDARLERLYSQAADAEPDSRLDDAVLGRARKAARVSRRTGLPHPGAWGVGIAAAASLVLAVGIVLHQGWQPSIGDVPGTAEPSESLMKDAEQPAAPAAGGPSMKQRGGEASEAKAEATELGRVQVTGSRIRREDRNEPRATPEREAEQAGMAAPATVDDDEHPGPEAWLEQIRELIGDGELDQARGELRDFQTHYPSARVPVDIREQLSEAPN